MIIKNINIYTENNEFKVGNIYIDGNYVKEVKVEDSKKDIEANNEEYYVIPGLIDVHFHGCVGYDFCDGNHEAIEKIAKYQLKNGITSIVPATMTLSEEELMKISLSASTYENKYGAELIGINMEGPFISQAKKGAQNSKYIENPNIETFKKLQEASNGMYKIVAIAPEEEGAMEFIESLKDEVVVSIAHTNATYETTKLALDKGAKHVNHLYNAMPVYSHREPGVIGATCDDEKCMVELICDGVHIHPCAIRTTFKMFGDSRIVLISDSMMATGMCDGEYTLGGQDVKVVGNKAVIVENGAIAGSVTNLMDCIRYAVKEVKIPLESAIKCATENPARAIGIYDKYGSIEAGKYANLVILDKDLNIVKVIIKGEVVDGN